MKMYVANCTLQVQDFQYRLPDMDKTLKQMIPIGGQILIPYDLTQRDIDFIVSHHAVYGMTAINEIDRTKAYAGLCYSIDNPINVDKLQTASDHNHGVLVERGRETRLEAAVVVNEALEKQTAEEGRSSPLKHSELTVEEVPTKDKDQEVNEKIQVSRSADKKARRS